MARTLPSEPSTQGARPTLLLLLGAALALGAWGQYRFLQEQEFAWGPLLAYMIAAFIFALAVSQHSPLGVARQWNEQDFWTRLIQRILGQPWRFLAMVGSLALTGVLLDLLQLDPPLPSYNWSLLLWIGATALYTYAVAGGRWAWPRRAAWQAWWQRSRKSPIVLTMGGVLLVALVLRAWSLETIPPTVSGDEGSQGLEAIRVLEGKITNPFGTGWLGVPTMSFYFNALTIGPLGNTIFALRLPWALVGTVTVLVVFLLVKRLCGHTLALVTAALLATYHYHIHFSRLGSNQVADTLFVAVALWLLYRGYDQRSYLDWALCGLVIGGSQYFYAGARFTGVLVIAVVLFLFLRDWRSFWRERYREVLVLLGATLIAGGPMIQYAIRFPNDYNARINEVGIFQSGWVEKEKEAKGASTLEVLLDQVKRASLAFNLYPDRTVWYGTPHPLMDFTAAILFTLGLGYSVLHIADRRIFPLVAWWGGAMIMGGALTESPPSSQRLITMAAPAIFFVALTLVQGGTIFIQGIGIRRPERFLLPYLSVAVLFLSFISIKWYFVEFTPLLRYGSYNAVVATSIGKQARDQLGADWRMYFFGPPRMYIGFGSILYLAPAVEGQDIADPLTAPIDRSTVPNDKNAAFIFLPERRNELDFVQQTFPNGEVEIVPSPLPGTPDPLYILYRVRRENM